jgi:hypothetical protein
MDEKVMHVSCDVVEKDAAGLNDVVSRANKGGSSATAAQSGVTNEGHAENAEGLGDTCSTPEEGRAEGNMVDWNTLTILVDENCDGEANVVVDEDEIYEVFGFKAADEVPIPNIPADVEAEMNEAAIPVNDDLVDEPMFGWDRDNPDMSVGTLYPCMDDFRMAVRQHAIVNEFELGTEKSDKERFRGHCGSKDCPWKIRARTQKDSNVRVPILTLFLST